VQRARLLALLALPLAACTESTADEVGAKAQALSAPLTARLTAVRQIATGAALEPKLSPDGAFVAFTGPKLRGLKVAPASGGPATTLTEEPAAGFQFAWSPDGESLAFATREEDGSSVLKTVSRQGGEPRALHRAAAGSARPLPRFSDSGELFFVDGTRLRSLSRGPLAPELPSPRLSGFSRKLDALVLAGDQGIWLADADGANARALLPGREFFAFTLSPDGATMLARELTADGGNLWSVDLASGKRVLLEGFDRGCILPSGTVIAEKLQGDILQLTHAELWAMRPDGSSAARIEGVPGEVPFRVDCGTRTETIAFAENSTDSVFVAGVEVLP